MDQTQEYIDIRDIFNIIYRGKYILISCIFISFAVGIGVSLFLQNVYTSKIVLGPSQSNNDLSLDSSTVAALSSFAGVNLRSNGSDEDLAIKILESRKFLVDFARSHNIVPELLAVKSWDASDHDLQYDLNLYDPEKKTWVRKVKPPLTPAPSDSEIYEKFKKILDVDRDPQTDFVTVSVTYVSPILAQSWATGLITDLNKQMSRDATDRLEKSIAYLEQQLERRDLIASVTNSISQVLQSQIRDRTLVDARTEYALLTIDPAYVPQFKSGPNRPLIVVIGGLVGAIIGVLVVLMLHVANPRIVKRLGGRR